MIKNRKCVKDIKTYRVEVGDVEEELGVRIRHANVVHWDRERRRKRGGDSEAGAFL